MTELTVPAKAEHLDEVIAFVRATLKNHGCTTSLMSQVELAVEEIYINIANYSYLPHEGVATIRCEVKNVPFQISIAFMDNGTPYNPLDKPDADIHLTAEERQIGGLGIFLAKKMMDDISYEFKDNQNILTLHKRL